MTKIYIENVPFEAVNADIRRKFETYGMVAEAHLIRDKVTKESRCFAFVEMPNAEEAAAAIAGLHDTDWDGKTLIVNESKPKVRS